MFKRLFIFFTLLTWLSGLESTFALSPDTAAEGRFILAQNFETEEEDGLDQEDSSGGDDDLFGEDEEEEDEDEEERDDEFQNRITFSSEYFLFGGNSYSNNADLANGNNIDTESILENIYQFKGKLQTSEYSYYYLRLSAHLRQKNNYQTDQYKEGYQVKIREGFYYHQDGQHRVQVGAKLLKHGKVDYKSPINVLGMSDSDAIDILNLSESQSPTFVLMYDWLGKGKSTSFLLAPFKQKTEGTEFTILKEETEDDEAGRKPDNSSVLRPHAGVRYQTNIGSLGTRWSAFHWFDRDNKISWKEQRNAESLESVDTDQDYQEEDSSVTFLTGELDWTLGSYVWKADLGYFFQKNFYHYEKTTDETNAYTVQHRHLAVATSLERKFDNLFLMPTYTYYKIWGVEAGDHIMTYENETTPQAVKHDVEKHQLSIIAGFEFSDDLNGSISLATTAPFKTDEVNISITWNPDGGAHKFSLNAYSARSEKVKMTNERIEKHVAFLTYAYKI